jgi:hypothetical protein
MSDRFFVITARPPRTPPIPPRFTLTAYISTKARPLPRPWPLLADRQNPKSLEARVAYHLHRLKLAGAPLRKSGFLPQSHLAYISQGRMRLSRNDVLRLAEALAIDVDAITRALTTNESAEWEFYRTSARHPRQVWQRARALWQSVDISDAEACRILKISRPTLAQSLVDPPLKPRTTLSFAAAARLSTALKLPGGPATFLQNLQSNDPSRSSTDIPTTKNR